MSIIQIIIQVVIAFLVILIPVGVFTSIALAIVAYNEKNLLKKKSLNRWAITLAIGPIALMFLLLNLWGLFRIITGTFAS